MTIQQFLDVSTIHTPCPDFADDLQDYVLAKGIADVFLFVPVLDYENDIPEWFKKVCELALLNGCSYIRFCSIGSKYPELTQFEWE